MSKKLKLLALAVGLAGVVTVSIVYLRGQNIAVLSPQGEIAAQQKELIILSSLLMLVIVVPVFALTAWISFKYREGRGAKYSPDWDRQPAIEALWWGIPLVIITILSVMAWNSSHRLDPFRPLVGDKPPLTVQVVALQWQWLFIYPDHEVASLNYVQIPVNTPISFEITADAPMNSFWIPRLGGQIYAMAGMETKLHLTADSLGSYRGQSANISGEGFASMTFEAKATSKADFTNWLAAVRKQASQLTTEHYGQLAQPQKNNSVAYFRLVESDLFEQIIAKYMSPGHQVVGATDHAHQEAQ